MFKAKHSHLAITQYEHLKLAGSLALLWGNDEFERPPCRFESFVKGVALHDRGYGFFDTLAIGEMSDDEWLAVSHRSFFGEYEDAVADLIIKHHILRLVLGTGRHAPEVLDFIKQMRDTIRERVHANGFDEKVFAFADRITNLCDQISFDFCFQSYGTGFVNVQKTFGGAELTRVEYAIEEGGVIKLSPWPLGVADYEGYLIGYKLPGFPDKLEPEMLAYTIRQF